jgi:hypothetical protein
MPGLIDNQLTWDEALGIGRGCDPDQTIYGADYWEKYRRYDVTSLGSFLTAGRIDFVRRHMGMPRMDDLIDIGIGGGRFVIEMPCMGFDVNPVARDWLYANGRFALPELSQPRAMTFWDSLEHMKCPRDAIEPAREWIFVSMPIYKNRVHCLKSKHFRPGEHVWYFTQDGIGKFMCGFGFELVEVDNFEQKLGREDILTFAFRRVKG